jgi:ketosteroid isomerase-like protein
MSEATKVLGNLYDAFAAGDANTLAELIGDTHWVEASGGPYGGIYRGLGEVAENVFGPIGRDVRNFTAVPDEILPVGDDRAIGLGYYRGETGAGVLETRFAHIATVDRGRITHFEQFTDTHEWRKAVGR